MKKITLFIILLTSFCGYSQNSVTVATSQAWNGYVNAFNLDDSYAFGFSYGAADLRATATTTSMTLEPNIAIWTAEATNAGWFDQGAATQTANKYIEASSYIEDNTLAGSDLTFTGNVSVSDLGSGYTVVAFVKALDPNNGYATVVNNTADISSTGDFTASATAAELAAGYIIQYGFAVTGPLADPADTTLGSVFIGVEAPPATENTVTVATSQAWNGYVNAFNLDDSYAFGFSYGAADLRATATTTSMTLEPNIAIWTAEATNAGWFDQGAATQTANKYIEASSYIEDNTLAGSDLTFTGNVSVSDLGSGYTVVAFVKALDPNNGYATVVNNTADISSTGDFTASATAAELAAGYIIQYGFAVTGPLADPADTTLGSVFIGVEAPPATENTVTVATSQAWNGYVNAFNLDDSYAFGFSYGAADLRATATTTSMTLEPNIAIWTAEATNAGWFDQGAATQTANKYIEASSYIEDNTLAGSDLTFTGNVSVSDLGSGYTVVAFVKALDPNNGYATVVNNTADISSTGDFTASATAAELAAGYIIQYGFAVTGPLADPADTTLGSVVIGVEAPPATGNSVTVATSQAWNAYVNAFNVSDNSYAFGFGYTVSDLRATPTTSSMTLEPNIAIWTAEATNAGWFDQGAATQTANKYIEASSYIEDNTLAGSDLTFTGNVSVSDLGSGYTVVAFVKALDPNNGYATVVNNTADISSTGDFTASATAAELAAGYIIQYGFAVTGPLADPTDTTLGSVVIGEATAGVEDNSIVNVSVYPNPSNSNWNFRTGNTVITSVEVFNLLGKRVVSQNNNSTEIAISTQGLSSGIYIARITTEQGVKSVKLIRE